MPQGLQATGAQFGDKTSGVKNLGHASGDSEVVHRKLWRRRSQWGSPFDNYEPSVSGRRHHAAVPTDRTRPCFPWHAVANKEEQQNEAIRSTGSVTRRTTPNGGSALA